MKISCKFTFKFQNKSDAKKINDSLEVDNYKFIKTKVEKDIIIADIESDSLMSLLHTIEDYLACLATAENVMKQTEGQSNKNDVLK